MQEQKAAVGKSSQALQEKDRELQKALKDAKVCTSHHTGPTCIHPSIFALLCSSTPAFLLG